MVSDSTFEEKLHELEQWVNAQDGLPEKIGEVCQLQTSQKILLRLRVNHACCKQNLTSLNNSERPCKLTFSSYRSSLIENR